MGIETNIGVGVIPFILPDGTINPASTAIIETLPFDSDQESQMFSDVSNADLHIYSNFLKNAIDSGYTNPTDFHTIIGATVYDNTSGIYPMNYKGQTRDATDGFNDQWDWVANDINYSYFADRYMYTDEGASPDALITDTVSGVNPQGDWISLLHHTGTTTTLLREANDILGSPVSMGMYFNTNERTAILRRENGFGQDFGFYGTSSSFGERTSRFYHQRPDTTVNQLFLQDDLLELQYRNIDILDIDSTGNTLRTFSGNTIVDNTVSKGLLEYSVDPSTTTGWSARSIPDKGYVDKLFDRAAITFSNNLTATTVSVVNDWYSITNTQPYSFTQRGTSFEQDAVVGGQINALNDNTVKTISAYINVVLGGAGTNKLEIAIFKNGTELPERGYRAVAGAYGTIQVVSPNVTVSNTDTFELKIRNTDSTVDLIVRNVVISID